MKDEKLGALIGTGREAEVFEFGDGVLKLYLAGISKHSAFREAAILSIIEASELNAPVVSEVGRFEGRWGLVMTKAPGQTFAEAMLSNEDQRSAYLQAMALLQIDINNKSGAGLRSLKTRLVSNIENSSILGASRQSRLLEQLAELPDGDRLCHGDFHPYNILGTTGQAMIVDWLDACSGTPSADISRTFILLTGHSPQLADSYLEAWDKAGGGRREDVLRWLPVVAAARLAENVPEDEDQLMRLVDDAI